MPSPEGERQDSERRERMDALAETIVRLLQRVEQMDARLAHLERLQPAGAPAPAGPGVSSHGVPMPGFSGPAVCPEVPPPLPPPLPDAGFPIPPPIPPAMLPLGPSGPRFAPNATPQNQPPRGQTIETRMGLTWINRIGVLTLIIGVAFFFKYAIDNQWIGETGRVIIGVLGGLAIVAGGDVLWRRGQKVFAQGLCGLGVSVLYLSFYASFGFYHLLPQAAAFALMVMVTAMAGALALRYDAMAIAALGMFGGYATPLLLSTGQDAPWTFFSYLFLIDLGAVAIARVKRWRPIELMAFLATAVLFSSWFGEWFRPEKRVVATAAVFAFYALFAFVQWAGIFYAVEVLTGLALAMIWPPAAYFLGLSWILGAAGLVIAGQTNRPTAATFSFVTYWGAYGLWTVSNGKPADSLGMFELLTFGFATYYFWTGFELGMRRVQIRTQHLTVLALNGIAYFACSYVLLNPQYHAWMGLLAAAVAGVHLVLGVKLWQLRAAESADTRPILLALGIALGFLTLAIPIQFTGFSITLSWALEAAALVWIGLRTSQDGSQARFQAKIWFGAGFIYALVLCRLYAYDVFLTSHPMLLNPRFVTFLVSAVSFGLGAWWIKSIRPFAAAAYVIGHFILLSACLFELQTWVETTVSGGNQISAMAIGVSILMALYAVILIVAGVVYRSALNRILGLGLIGLVVLKLYLYDVWEASRLFRMAAFVSLGILLLLTSYLYSRFRPVIESLWKDEDAGA